MCNDENYVCAECAITPASDPGLEPALRPCAEVSCFYNDDCLCLYRGYTGPTMEGSCPHYSRD